MIAFKNIVEAIHEAQLQTLVPLETFREKEYLKTLPTRNRGMYWLWTSLSFDDLERKTKISTKEEHKEVPIKKLITQRKDLKNTCKIQFEDYVVVYNGIGGYKKEPASFGLRERINQEVKANGPTVGTLNILQNSNIKQWAVSYFNFDDPINEKIISQLNSKNPYIEFAKDLEMLWRLEYGTPILTRH